MSTLAHIHWISNKSKEHFLKEKALILSFEWRGPGTHCVAMEMSQWKYHETLWWVQQLYKVSVLYKKSLQRYSIFCDFTSFCVHNVTSHSHITQGSVLGPLLFLLYVNDLCRSSDKLSFYLFADDTNLLYADRDINSLERVVNAELSKVQEWLVANRLTLNAKKSNFVIFHPYQKKLDRDVIPKIFDIETNDFVLLDQKTYIKYLDILIDSNLTWKYHISYITSKISKTIGVIARLRHFVPTSTLLTLFRSLLSPYLLYGLLSGARHHRFTLIKSLFCKSVLCALSTLHHIDLLLSLFLFPLVVSQSASFILKQCRF